MAGYTIAELPMENINIRTPEAYRADKASAIDSAVRRGKLPPGMAKSPTHTPALDRISASMQARNAPKPKIGMMKQASGVVKSAGGAATLAAVPWGVMKAAQVGGADVPDAAVDHPLEFIGTGLAQAYADKMPEFMGGLPKSTVDSARAAGISAFDGTRFDVNQPAIAKPAAPGAPQPAAGQAAATGAAQPYVQGAGLPSAEQVASDKERARVSEQLIARGIPIADQGGARTSYSDAQANSMRGGGKTYKLGGGGDRTTVPGALDGSVYDEGNADIYASSTRKDGKLNSFTGVGDASRPNWEQRNPEAYQAAIARGAADKAGVVSMAASKAMQGDMEGAYRMAAGDPAATAAVEQALQQKAMQQAVLKGNSGAASVLNQQGANEVNKLRIAADLAPKPVSAYDQERTRGAKMENDRSAIMDGLLSDFMGAKDDKARESALAKLNAINGKNAGADKYIMGEVEAGVDALGNPIMRKTPFNTRTGQYVGMEGARAPAANDGDIQEGDYLRGSDGKAYRRVNGQNVLVQ